MFFIGLVFILGIAFTVGAVVNEREEYYPYYFEPIFVSLGLTLVAVLLALGLSFLIGSAMPGSPLKVERERTVLKSLADNDEIHGHFFLGSGNIDSDPYYSWYEAVGENSYKRNRVEAGKVTIHIIAKGKQPYYTRTWKWHPYNVKAFYINGTNKQGGKYDFYVPQNTIKENYVLDAE